jgi:hypothetical protein
LHKMTSPLKDSTAAPLPLPPQPLTAVPVAALTGRAVVSCALTAAPGRILRYQPPSEALRVAAGSILVTVWWRFWVARGPTDS